MTNMLDTVLRIMSEQHGRDLSALDSRFLSKAVAERQVAASLPDADAYLRCLSESRMEADALQSRLSITFTDFFREPLAFALLERQILPSLASRKSGSEIRVWSAGCASGQEAYSLAMLLANAAEAMERPVRFRIFATDISESALAVARAGKYARHSLGRVRLELFDRYFEPLAPEGDAHGVSSGIRQSDSFMIRPDIRKTISFSHYDLLDESSAHPAESIYGSFDLVSCSNLLFYYKPPFQQAIIRKLIHALAPGGYLMTGETEAATLDQSHRLSPLRVSAPIYTVA